MAEPAEGSPGESLGSHCARKPLRSLALRREKRKLSWGPVLQAIPHNDAHRGEADSVELSGATPSQPHAEAHGAAEPVAAAAKGSLEDDDRLRELANDAPRESVSAPYAWSHALAAPAALSPQRVEAAAAAAARSPAALPAESQPASCPICDADLSALDTQARLAHANTCADACASPRSAERGWRCPVCAEPLGPLSAAERNTHVLACVGADGAEAAREDEDADFAREAARPARAHAEQYRCELCGRDLTLLPASRRNAHVNGCLERAEARGRRGGGAAGRGRGRGRERDAGLSRAAPARDQPALLALATGTDGRPLPLPSAHVCVLCGSTVSLPQGGGRKQLRLHYRVCAKALELTDERVRDICVRARPQRARGGSHDAPCRAPVARVALAAERLAARAACAPAQVDARAPPGRWPRLWRAASAAVATDDDDAVPAGLCLPRTVDPDSLAATPPATAAPVPEALSPRLCADTADAAPTEPSGRAPFTDSCARRWAAATEGDVDGEDEIARPADGSPEGSRVQRLRAHGQLSDLTQNLSGSDSASESDDWWQRRARLDDGEGCAAAAPADEMCADDDSSDDDALDTLLRMMTQDCSH